MRSKKITTTVILLALVSACFWLRLRTYAQQSPTPTISAPAPSGLPAAPQLQSVSFLKDGALWLMKEDGSDSHQIVPAPEESAIANQVWARDGSRIYFNIGLNIYDYQMKEQKVESLGTLGVPEGVSIDRIELGGDDKTLLFQTIDANDALNSIPRIFAMSGPPVSSKELSIDEYHALAPVQSTLIRNVGELSVSPDGKFVLFTEAVGKDIQLFVSDIETGNRHQVTDLGFIDDFEATAMQDGGRRIIEATWLPDGRHIVFVPAQTCSEFGLCSGKMYLVDAWGGAQLQLALEMTTNISQEWNRQKNLLIYDDGGKVLIADTQGQVKQLALGNQPRWQPAS